MRTAPLVETGAQRGGDGSESVLGMTVGAGWFEVFIVVSLVHLEGDALLETTKVRACPSRGDSWHASREGRTRKATG